MRVTLGSGRTLSVLEIKLFGSVAVDRLQELGRSIGKNFRGFSTGIGFVGSAAWVIGGSKRDGSHRRLLSRERWRRRPPRKIEEARELCRRIRRVRVFVDVGSIDNVELPEIENWRVPHFETVHRKELVQMQSNHVTVKTDGRELNLFRDKVEQYAYSG